MTTLADQINYFADINNSVSYTLKTLPDAQKKVFDNLTQIHIPTSGEWQSFFDDAKGIFKNALDEFKSGVVEIALDSVLGRSINAVQNQAAKAVSDTVRYLNLDSDEERGRLQDSFNNLSQSFSNLIGIGNSDGLGFSETKINDKRINSKVNNPNIRDLLLSGPSLYTNMFDVFFIINDDDMNSNFSVLLSPDKLEPPSDNLPTGNSSTESIEGVLKSLVQNNYSFSVLTASVSIPQRSLGTSAIPFLCNEISIPNTTWGVDTKCNLKLTVDSNTYIPEIFSAIAGLKRPGKVPTIRGKNSATLVENNYNILAPNVGKNLLKIDLYVSAHSLSGYNDGKYMSYGSDSANILYMFEDIKFLGVNGGISFSNKDAGGKNTCTVPFIYKDFKTYYKPESVVATSGETMTKYNSDFNRYLQTDSISQTYKSVF